MREALRKHNDGKGPAIVYDKKEKVYQLKNLEEFDEAVLESNELVMAVCFHNECSNQEK